MITDASVVIAVPFIIIVLALAGLILPKYMQSKGIQASINAIANAFILWVALIGLNNFSLPSDNLKTMKLLFIVSCYACFLMGNLLNNKNNKN
jgi:hypothetical protein